MRRYKIPTEQRSLNKYLKSLQLTDDQKLSIAELSDKWDFATETERVELVKNTKNCPTFAAFSQGS